MLNRALLADMIGDAYRIIEAEDGKQAVAALQKEGAGISLVLLDYVMPQMNGFDVLEVMNKNGWIGGADVFSYLPTPPSPRCGGTRRGSATPASA